MSDIDLQYREQQTINSRLFRGILFSNLWCFGIGSLYSLILGIRVLRAIDDSDYQLRGKYRAWWCVVVGGLGTLFLFCVLLAIVLYYLGIGER
jgi:uncharacterized membrane protein YdcZ (DUF606 family)